MRYQEGRDLRRRLSLRRGHGDKWASGHGEGPFELAGPTRLLRLNPNTRTRYPMAETWDLKCISRHPPPVAATCHPRMGSLLGQHAVLTLPQSLCRDAVPTLPAKAMPSRGHAGTVTWGHGVVHLPWPTGQPINCSTCLPLVPMSPCPRVPYQGRMPFSAFSARSRPSVSPINGTG
ncbi:MAG: hypothetical protein RI969_1692 [Verrucomicrobiota bacterium]|jgi:hypothetical protein